MTEKKTLVTKTLGRFTGKIIEIDRKNGKGYIKTRHGKKTTFYLNNLPRRVKAKVGLDLRFTMKQQGTRMPIARCISVA